MIDKNDSSEGDPETLAQSIIKYSRKLNKRTANWERETGVKKRRKHHQRFPGDSSDNELPLQLSRRNSHYDSQISPERNGESSQISVLTSSDNMPSFLNNPQRYHLKFMRLPPDYKKLLHSCSQLRPNNTSLFSNNRSEKDPKMTDTNAFDLSNDLKSSRNLLQSVCAVPKTENLPNQIKLNHKQGSPNSEDNADGSFKEKSSFKPSYVFHNLFGAVDYEAEELPCEWRIFYSNLPMDVLSEEQLLLRDIRNVFEKEGKFKNSINQLENLNIHQTLDKDKSLNPVDQDCCDWDKFLDRWEGKLITSDSTSEAQHHEKIIEEDEACSLVNSTSTGAKKCLHIAKSPEKIERCKPSSLAEELEMMVLPIPSDVSESNAALEKFKIKMKSKIEFPEDNQTPPFLKNFGSPVSANLSNRTNSFQANDSDFDSVPLNMKSIINFFKKNFIFEENLFDGTNKSTNKMKKSISTPPVFNDCNGKKIIDCE